ncbi:PQQ-binding-like beta-propeller repeat protein [bacterium]|nr:PQQ-binding-like beta-propeller repeat protein [bacterium]
MSEKWSNAELVRLCLEGTARDLTDEAVVALGHRLPESLLVRDAVAESPFSGQIKARLESLGLSVELPVDRSAAAAAGEPQKSRPSQSMKPAAAILAVILVGWLLLTTRSPKEKTPEDQPAARQERPGDAGGESKTSEQPDGDEDGSVEPTPTDAVAEDKNSAVSDKPTGSDGAAVAEPATTRPSGKVETSEEPTEKPAEPAAEPSEQPASEQTSSTEPAETVVGPWGDALDRDVAPLRFEEVAWRLPGDDGIDEFPPDEFRQWFEPMPGRPFGLLDEQHSGRRFSKFDGMARLKAGWVESAVLRLTVYDTETCELHVWSGNDGVRIKYFRHRQPNVWAVHRISRANETSPLIDGGYLTNDCGRWHRSQFGVVELRWERERLWLSRGNLVLLSVPFSQQPTEIALDGKLKIRDVEMLKSDPLPEVALSTEIATQPLLAASQPARLKWEMLGEEASPGSMKPHGDSIELRIGADSKEPARMWAAAPLAGLCEFVFRIESADAGTGVYLGDPNGEPIILVARLWDPKARRSAVQLLQPNQRDTERTYDVDAWPAPWSGDNQWLRVVMGSGSVSLWTSPDGRGWAWVADSPARGRFPGQRASIGVFAQPQADRHIRISHVEVNEFPALASLADAELLKRVDTEWFEPLDVLDTSSWLQRVIRHRPADVNFEDWRRACAVATLRASADNELSNFLISGLLAENVLPAVAAPSDDSRALVAEQLARSFALLHEASLFCDLWDGSRGQDIGLLYHEVARRAARRARPEATETSFSAQMMRELLRTEFWSGHTPRITPLDAVEFELTALIEAGAFDTARQLIDKVIFWNANGHPARPWWQTVEEIYPRMAWAELAAQSALDSETRAARQELPGRWKTNLTIDRHPLAHSVSKEAYNVMAEFQAAVSGNAFDDACAVISSAASTELLGLLPDSQDGRLMISFPNAVALAMSQQPQLRRTMNEQFGAIGRLRVREAIQNADHRRIEAATVQFFGTLAAAESAAWLGDRALAAGRFAAARSYFERALSDYQLNSQIETSEQRALRAKLELTERLSESPAQAEAEQAASSKLPGDAPLEFNSTSVATTAFNSLLTELDERAKSAGPSVSSSDVSLTPLGRPMAARLPDVGGFRVENRSRYDGDQGENPGSSVPSDVDWVARQLAVEVAGDSAFFCNRYQLGRFDLTNGQTRWKQQLGGDHANAHHWPMVPLRPLVTADAVYCRRLRKDGTELICCDRESGNVRWTLRPGQGMVSDPFFVRGRLQIFLAGDAYAGPSVLELTTIHAETGTVISSVPVLNLFDVWQNSVPVCQVMQSDGLIYFTVSGVGGCCNSEGQLLWIRRREWMPPTLDRDRRMRHWSPPVIDGQSVVLFEPESPVVDRVDAATGRLKWSLTMPGFRRCLAAVDGRLLLEDEYGVRAVDLQTGQNLWQYLAANLLDAVLVPESGGRLLLTRAVPFAEGRTREMTPTLIWLDLTTGHEAARLPLTTLRDGEPRVGPLLSGPEKTWLLFGPGRKESNRDVLELVSDDNVRPAFPADLAAWADWHPEARLETAPQNRLIRPDLERAWQSNEFRNACERLAAGWLPVLPIQPKESGLVAEFRGQRDVLRLRPKIAYSPETANEVPSELTVGAARLFRPLRLRNDANTLLRFKAGHNQGESWLLTVEANGERLLNTIVNDETAPSGWQQVDVRLGHLAGKDATLIITCAQADPKTPAWVFLYDLPDPMTLAELSTKSAQ